MAERQRIHTAIGLMSGTSMDGVDASLLRTDGHTLVEPGPSLAIPYPRALRDQVAAELPGAMALTGPRPLPPSLVELEREITHMQADVVLQLLEEADVPASEVDVIGFHGQTVAHRPDAGWTLQLGDGRLMAAETGIDVVNDFRSADMAAGGEGAPLAPLYHLALTHEMEGHPIAVLNLGGIGNVTYIAGADAPPLAFDTGPANALIDEWALARVGEPFDRNGALARSGTVNETVLSALMDNPYFTRTPPKSLDRLDFSYAPADHLPDADGAATLVAFTVESIARAIDHLPQAPRLWIVVGGGRRNPVLMGELQRRLGVRVIAAEEAGWRGDTLEAEAFAYLAVRSLMGLPLSLPTTTGVGTPTPGGTRHRAGAQAA
ncbi:anhydro-N-acetylmuramic acid kinase [Pyruvatibacter mobilis]|uniref:anhydro-N-acetylmuramic acid kinase n=1 Tax=Pyruvatibacter mobilis TaxID=1712261 RepID=UPI003D0A2FDE